jgi:DNA-binding transcriptional regulator LsrR (DeoR family)
MKKKSRGEEIIMPPTGADASALSDRENDLCVRAAWLHYGAGLTQTEVAARLGASTVKAHRLIARANKLGLVRVHIEGEIAACVALEEAICARYGLNFCQVSPDLDEGPLPLRGLSVLGARFLEQALTGEAHEIIGFGHGRTLAACVNALPQLPKPRAKLVSLLGGLTHRLAATPYDVIHRLAERTGAEAYVLPLPIYCNSPEDRAVMLEQRGVRPVVDMGISATLRIVGVGALEPDSSPCATGMVEAEELMEARRAGGVGEVLGHIFALSGELVQCPLSARALSMPAREIGAQRTVAIAGGKVKTEAIRAALASGLMAGLITDERTAHALARAL